MLELARHRKAHTTPLITNASMHTPPLRDKF
jgi:hypothetical protein